MVVGRFSLFHSLSTQIFCNFQFRLSFSPDALLNQSNSIIYVTIKTSSAATYAPYSLSPTNSYFHLSLLISNFIFFYLFLSSSEAGTHNFIYFISSTTNLIPFTLARMCFHSFAKPFHSFLIRLHCLSIGL